MEIRKFDGSEHFLHSITRICARCVCVCMCALPFLLLGMEYEYYVPIYGYITTSYCGV
ncbi:hypothetical protein B0T26DRAFT_697374 [Lasiosphaeria miniovina]|uniref:Uncharacterized protein n=1 Tax=Lasiosphaeria miniovina TaxID=1954250 RepID=A0AA40B626_9PEZI|nr:uncharacterized protein B0T26DRAFT_697374 [Lasiosphaeria miniovina]KAK0728244.1 hypothetical protein B0T26DRAFT_697374 [Lasiosphaeria miniovina]